MLSWERMKLIALVCPAFLFVSTNPGNAADEMNLVQPKDLAAPLRKHIPHSIALLRQLGFTIVRALMIPTNLAKDWTGHRYLVEKGTSN